MSEINKLIRESRELRTRLLLFTNELSYFAEKLVEESDKLRREDDDDRDGAEQE